MQREQVSGMSVHRAVTHRPSPPPMLSSHAQDLASAAARGAGGRSVVGLWPGFSYFNHSCLPSTVHYVVGESMVVRAVTEIEAGAALAASPGLRGTSGYYVPTPPPHRPLPPPHPQLTWPGPSCGPHC
jgi:hypothetical protein